MKIRGFGELSGCFEHPGRGDRSPVKDGKGDEVMRVGTQKGKTREGKNKEQKKKKRVRKERERERWANPRYRVTGTVRGYCFPISRPLYRFALNRRTRRRTRGLLRPRGLSYQIDAPAERPG